MITLFPPWKNAVARVERGEYKYGDLIPESAIDELLGLEKPKGRVEVSAVKSYQLARLNALDSFKKALLNDLMMDVESVPGQGYRIVNPKEQTELAVKAGDKAIKKALRNTRDRLVNVNYALLDSDQRRQNTDAIVRTAAIAQQFNQIKRGHLPELPKRIRRLNQENQK